MANDYQQSTIKLFISVDGGAEQEVEVSQDEIFVGAGADNTIQMRDSKRTVSRKHLRLITEGNRIYVEDLGSTNGTFLGDKSNRLPANKPIRVKDGDILWLGPNVRLRLKVSVGRAVPGKAKKTVVGKIPYGELDDSTDEVLRRRRKLEIPTGRSVIVGRESDCDITVDHPQVSRHHAKITLQMGGILVEDLRSTNGTFVNGKRVVRELMGEGDILGIGPVAFSISPKMGTIVEERLPGEGVRLDGRKLTRVLKSGKCILPPTDLTIMPGEFMGILGASGSGKTTLMTLLNGSVIPTGGFVWLNGLEMVSHYSYLKQQIGYVPQHDIIHSELSVSEILYYAAKLRLPEDLTKGEIEDLIGNTLRIVGLSDKWGADFKELSGGEKKRINMAVELIIDPQIFFLDEPTSGLDPGIERDVMELFERYSHNENKSVVMVTHVTQNVSLMDKLIILEKGGNTAFFGAPNEALDFFKVGDFVEIYQKIEGSKPKVWSSRYSGSSTAKRHKYIHQRVEKEAVSKGEEIKEKGKGIFRRFIDWFRQLSLLTTRYSKIVIKDARNLITLLLQAPIVAILAYFVFQGTGDNGQMASLQEEFMLDGLYFVLILAAIWFGANNSAREISKEGSVYRRERMVFLKIGPYLLSKFIVLSVVSLFQSVILVLMLKGMVGLEGNTLHIILIVYLTAISGVTLGLFISSVVKSTNMAISLIPIVLIPQIIFCGLIRPVEEMDRVSQGISKVCVAYWSFSTAKQITIGETVYLEEEPELDLPSEGAFMKLSGEEELDDLIQERYVPQHKGEPTYENFKRNLIIIGGFILIFFILAYLALLAKERGGFENR